LTLAFIGWLMFYVLLSTGCFANPNQKSKGSLRHGTRTRYFHFKDGYFGHFCNLDTNYVPYLQEPVGVKGSKQL
jgi:hypothetical protein